MSLSSSTASETVAADTWGDVGVRIDNEGLFEVALGRGFRILRSLGSGGMGVVYLAEDEALGGLLALKTMHCLDARSQARLKNEFRSLARIRHPNLVQLYELHAANDCMFFTMEYIDGTELSEFVDNLEPTDTSVEQLAALFAEIAAGVRALHAEGLLHLDLKPANVMVDASGRAKILDFGLVRSHRPIGLQRGVQNESRAKRAPGTRRYMAPDFAHGAPPSQATDWYAFGLILQEALEGLGSNRESELTSRQADLMALCRELLVSATNARSFPSVLSRLSPNFSNATPVPPIRRPLIGRQQELSRIGACLSNATNGQSAWLDLHGPGGVGKSSLLGTVSAQAQRRANMFVMKGRCHEREAMLFQGLEGVMDDLAAHVFADASAEDLKEEIALAASIFSAFRRDHGATSREASDDPLARRRLVFQAIKKILVTKARDRTVVLVIDDVHWGDRDAARLLAELLAAPTTPRLLVLTARRPCAVDTDPFVEELESILIARSSDARRIKLAVEPLSRDDMRTCLQHWNVVDSGQVEAIVDAARGLPFLGEALSRHAWAPASRPNLPNLIERFLRSAPQGASDVLRAICLTPFPIPQSTALKSTVVGQDGRAILASLRHSSLVRTCGHAPGGPLEPYHSLIREAVCQATPFHRQCELRHRIARRLETQSLAGLEQLATLYELAGDRSRAAEYAPKAAEEALAALAFDRAARWFDKALEWGAGDELELLVRSAQALTCAGRGAEAAERYRKAAELSTTERAMLERKAASAWLAAGHLDRGISALEPHLQALGLGVSATPGVALFRLAPVVWKLLLRSGRISRKTPRRRDLKREAAADAAWECAKALGVVMPVHGLFNQLSSLQLSLEVGDPVRIARSLAVLSVLTTTTALEGFGEAWMARARQIGREQDDPYLHGVILTMTALARLARWDDPHAMLVDSAQATGLLKRSAEPTTWEEQVAIGLSFKALQHAGKLDRLVQEAPAWLAESAERGDLFAQTVAAQFVATGCLAEGRLADARTFAERSVQRWSERAFTVQHHYAVRLNVEADLYAKDHATACQRLRASWDKIVGAHLLKNPISRPEILLLLGVVELERVGAPDRSTMRRVSKIALQLERSRGELPGIHGRLLRAAIDFRRGDQTRSMTRLSQVVADYRKRGLVLLAGCAELRLEQARGSDIGSRRVQRALQQMGVAEPDRYATLYAPRLLPRA